MAGGSPELHYLTIAEASRLLQRRELSPVELTRAFLERIQAVDGKTRAYVTLLAESAMAEAQQAEQEIGRGQYRGPLHGIPLALKDLYNTTGVRTTGQSRVLEHHVPAEDATTVALLRRAGMVLLGKLAMWEWASGGPQTSLFEQARNPWDLERVTGSSSSGSGAAVAAGLCMGSLGSDTGGSIRDPASLCGIVGLKPTYGRVSRYGVLPLAWSLDHAGPMTRTVEDTAIMLQAIAGHDPRDPTTSTLPVPDYRAALREDVRGLRIGVARHYFFDPATGLRADAAALVEAAIGELAAMGAQVEEVTIPSLHLASIANQVIIRAEAFAFQQRNLALRPQDFGDIVRTRFYLGGLITGADYVQAQRVRSRIKREMREVFQRVDMLAAPAAPGPAPTFASYEPFGTSIHPNLLAPFNLAGLPAISVPCGFTQEHMPMGLQLAGRPFDEGTVLRAAHAYERRTRWHTHRPPL